MNPEPPPFGDPTNIQRENADAVKKGVTVGCAGCATVLMLFVGFIALIVMTIFYFMRSSEACQMALEEAKKSAVLRRELGEPMTLGWIVTGSVNTASGAGKANLSVPVSGPKQSATLQISATQTDGVWQLNEARTALPSGEPVDLLNDAP